MENKTTGKLIAFHRHLLGIKQEQLAADTDICQSSISDIENDKISPTVNQLIKISQVFNVNPSELLPTQSGITATQTFSDNATINGSNVTHNYGNLDEERKIFRELLDAKDSIIKIKDQIIENLQK